MRDDMRRPGIVEDFLALKDLAAREVTSADELAANLGQVYRAVFEVDLDKYDPAEVKAAAPVLMRANFEMRVDLRERIPGWQTRGLMTPAVESALRNVLRVSRYGGDMLGELYSGFDTDRRGRRAFTGGGYKTMVNPAYYDGRNIAYRSGDVLLMRGAAHNSAAIARIGDIDSQFSHIGVIHVDEEGRPWVVEALIEVGSVVTRLEHVLDHGLGRAALYRHRDPVLAEAAARHIHKRVKRSQGRWRRPILYDFSFQLEGYSKLFCSKLVRQAYDLGSGGKLLLPTFKTRLDMKNRDFFDRIGVTARETFAPSDIDLEPGFDLVTEWHDYRQTSRLRLQDLMMDKVFEWMERDGWTFRETALVRVVSVLGKAASYLSEDAKTLLQDVLPRVPVNMTRRTVAVVAMLHQTGEELMKSLTALEENSIRMRGRPAHPREVLARLDEVRQGSDGRIGYLAAPN